ncbi:class I SAM-dependent methyltransferase [Halosegnis sp.]|uniref:class I SAM-dependent methyltransferase n=1 Tax=Halosegnis sp. TaxID=2864959 RepID=UPI0035D48E24
MHGHLASPDVRRFDRFARLYDLAMPPADAATLGRGFAFADRDIEQVLDVGGGTGRAARSAGEGADGTLAIVVDAAAGMVREATANGAPALLGLAEQLPIGDETVDAVTVVDALHHFADAETTLAEAARVLRPGGVLVIREFDPATLRGRLLAGAERAIGFGSRFYTSTALLEAIRAVGLVSFRPETGFAYTVVGRKRRD